MAEGVDHTTIYFGSAKYSQPAAVELAPKIDNFGTKLHRQQYDQNPRQLSREKKVGNQLQSMMEYFRAKNLNLKPEETRTDTHTFFMQYEHVLTDITTALNSDDITIKAIVNQQLAQALFHIQDDTSPQARNAKFFSTVVEQLAKQGSQIGMELRAIFDGARAQAGIMRTLAENQSKRFSYYVYAPHDDEVKAWDIQASADFGVMVHDNRTNKYITVLVDSRGRRTQQLAYSPQKYTYIDNDKVEVQRIFVEPENFQNKIRTALTAIQSRHIAAAEANGQTLTDQDKARINGSQARLVHVSIPTSFEYTNYRGRMIPPLEKDLREIFQTEISFADNL